MGFWDKFKKEVSDTDSDKTVNESRFPTQTMLLIRVFVAGYLLYLSYDLFVTRESSSIKLWQLILILTLFIVCSIYILITSIFMLVRGQYVGGKADVEEVASEANPEEASEADAPAEEAEAEIQN